MTITHRTFVLDVTVDGDFDCDVAQAIQATLEGETIATMLDAGKELTVIIDSVVVTERGGMTREAAESFLDERQGQS